MYCAEEFCEIIRTFIFGGHTTYLNFILLSLHLVSIVDKYGITWAQKRGLCGHLIASFDKHSYCARYRDKRKSAEPCINNKDCVLCNVLSGDQKAHLATATYQKKKEKCEQNFLVEESSSTLVDPVLVSVLGTAKNMENIKSSDKASSTPDVAKVKKFRKHQTLL